MSCNNSKLYNAEEIEKKRLAAIQRKNQRHGSNGSSSISPKPIQQKPATFFQNTPSPKASSFFQNSPLPKPSSSHKNENQNFAQSKATNSNSFVMRPQSQANRFNPLAPKPIPPKPFYGSNTETTVTAKLYVISKSRFTVETSNFCQPLIDTIKTVKDRLYGTISKINILSFHTSSWMVFSDIETKTWNFLFKDYDEVVRKIRSTPNVILSEIPRCVIQVH